MSKKKKQSGDEGGQKYSWMDTYGDMVTLLLCFFVLLYAFSSTSEEKWQMLVGAFTGVSTSSVMEPLDVDTLKQDEIEKIDSMVNMENRDSSQEGLLEESVDQQFDELYYAIRNYIQENGLEDQLNVSRTDDTVILRFGEVFLFNSGSAKILDSSEPAMTNIVEIIGQNQGAIQKIYIEGHTDTVPMHNEEFSDNWELSMYRAYSTMKYVLEKGILDESMLCISGYSEFQPVDTNDTAEGRSRNRRVDFILEKLEVD